MVINIAEFREMCSTKATEVATRELCFVWLAHLYLACLKLRALAVVLTHKRELTDDQFEASKIRLLDDFCLS